MCRLVSMYAHVIKLFVKIIVLKRIIIIINTYVSLMYVSRYVIKNINVIYKLLSYDVAPESAIKPRIKNDNPLVG